MTSDVASSQAGPVVVGIDGSRTAPGTLDLAAAEAVRRRAALQIVHVWPGRYTGVFRSRGALVSMADGRRLLDVAQQRARLAGGDLPMTTELLEGGAAQVLTRCSAGAGLLVVGHRDDQPMRLSWGSTAAYLAHHSECPLLVNRGAAGRDGPVVVATSARSSGAGTLGYAFAEAALRGAGLVAVHMWARPGAVDGTAPVVPAGGYAAERAAAEGALAEALTVWGDRFPQVRVERLVVHDLDLAYTIARASQRACLLVAGIGRHGRFAELLYGSSGAGPAGPRPAPGPVVLVPAAAGVPAGNGPAGVAPH